LMEYVRLRVKDVDLAYLTITDREPKGGKDRITMLPTNLAQALQRHLLKRRSEHEQDLADGSVMCISHMPWRVNIRTRHANGCGSTSLLHRAFLPIRVPATCNGIMLPRASFNEQ